MRNIILKYTALLLAGHLFNYWLLYYSPLNLPERIPHTPINIGGLFLIVLVITILIFFQKTVLKLDNQKTVLQLTVLGALVCFLSELLFQVLRFPTVAGDTLSQRIYYCIRGIIVVPLMCIIPSFFIAFQLKTKKTKLLLFMILIFFVLVGLLKNFYPSLFPDNN
jgi:cytochrome bd-type quinol oxidase subunit 2